MSAVAPSTRKPKTYGKAVGFWCCCFSHRCYLFGVTDCLAWFFGGGCISCCSCWELTKMRELVMAANNKADVREAKAEAKANGGLAGVDVREKSCGVACLAWLCCLSHRAYLFGFKDYMAWCVTCGPLRTCCSCCELRNLRELSLAGSKVVRTAPGEPAAMK